MLARDNQGHLEVLLLKRNKALKFAGGLWVFPGGKIDVSELELAENELEAARMAAVRETREEASLAIPPEQLTFFSHWTTPKIEPRRYATWFFFGSIQDPSLEVRIDDSEVKDHLWINPQNALDQFECGQLAMMPPTYISLQRIRKCKTIESAHRELTRFEPFFILPVLQLESSNMYCLYEGDAGYESGDFRLPGARHRLVGNMLKGNFVFEYNDCESIIPVNGGMHL